MPKGIMIVPMIILGIIFLQGLLNAVNPKFMWKTFESWKALKEPDNSYFVLRRILGVVAMVIVALMFLVPHMVSN